LRAKRTLVMVGEGFLLTTQSFLLLSVGTELSASCSMETD